MWTKMTKTGMITLATALALAGCKDSKKLADAGSESLSTATKSVQKVDLSGTPLERLEKAMAYAKASKGEGVPSMWKMSDEDTDIYIFGTFHLLPEGVNWRTSKFDAVLEDMNALYVEADIESPEALQKLQMGLGQASLNTDGTPLSEAMGDDYGKIAPAFTSLGVPEASVEPMLAQMEGVMPWAVGLSLTQMQLQSFGYNMETGVEKTLLSKAKADGITVGYLEEGIAQIKALSGNPKADQIESLKLQLATFDSTKDQLETLMGEWADGDENGIGVLMANPDVGVSKVGYNLLLKDRNTAWIPKIEAILDDPGTKLVAVGAGHLAGPDSVITMLESKGHKVEVIQ